MNAKSFIFPGTRTCFIQFLKRYQVNNHSQAAMRLPELMQRERASLADAYLLAFFLGLFGAHYFYLRHPRWGFLYLFTFGLLGAGWLIDLFRLKFLVSRFNEDTSNQNQDVAKKKRLDDAYVLWFSGGLLGMCYCFSSCNSKKQNHYFKINVLI